MLKPPSKQVRESFADLSAQSDIQLRKLKNIVDTDLKALNKMINEKQLPLIGVKN